MWYHYLFILAGLYLVGSAVYSIISNRSMTNLILSGIQIVVGGGIAYYGYSGVTAPEPTLLSAVPGMAAMTGGFKKLFRR